MKKLPVIAVLAALASTAAIPVERAQAQTLFDLLFKNRQEGRPTRDIRRAPDPVQPQALPTDPITSGAVRKPRQQAVRPVVQAARYFAYKPANLVPVAVADLTQAGGETAAMPLGQDLFSEGLRIAADETVKAERFVRDNVTAYYQNNPGFIWVSGYAPNAKAEAVREVFAQADAVGLSAADYAVPVPDAGFDMADTAGRLRALMRFELAMSAAAVRYARDAYNGRIEPGKLSDYHDFAAKDFKGAAFLKRLSTSPDAANLLLAQNPSNRQFGILTAELRRLRAEGAAPGPVIAPDTFIRPGQDNPELPDVLQLVGKILGDELTEDQRVLLYENRDSTVYAPALVPLVRAAQKARGVGADGVVGPNTIRAFQGQTNSQKIRAVEASLERLRWLPNDFGQRYVFINQPAYWASYMENGTEKLGMRVVVGTRKNQTSFFQDQIEYVEFNPYWGVPRSILVNEMLPKLQRDPSYLDRIGYETFTTGGKRISSSSVDWWNGGANRVSVRQPPSEKNALGELKIMFPNKHDIYMHDTPQKALFSRDQRAFSHGCVRLQQPREMAAAVLGTDVEHIRQRLAKGHNSQKLDKPIPVYVSYFTAWPDQTGTVQYYGDVYDRDSHLAEAFQATDKLRQAETGELSAASEAKADEG